MHQRTACRNSRPRDSASGVTPSPSIWKWGRTHRASSMRWAALGASALPGPRHLVYEYNMMIIERSTARSKEKLTRGSTGSRWTRRSTNPAGPPTSCSRSTARRSRAAVKRTVPAAFTASETFDVGGDLGSPVSRLLRPGAVRVYWKDPEGGSQAQVISVGFYNAFAMTIAVFVFSLALAGCAGMS